VKEVSGIDVRMSDGVVLRATIDYPADPDTGQIAAGRFPTLLTITPYGKASVLSGGGSTGTNPYLVRRGYLDISVDVRGTGASGGTFELFAPVQIRDSVELVHWAAGLPRSTGKVGMHGTSYLGINQLFAAGAVGPDSPLKAIFPIVAANDVYRDAAFMGGIPDLEFDSFYLGGVLPACTGSWTTASRPTWSAASTTCSSAAPRSTTPRCRTPGRAGRPPRRWIPTRTSPAAISCSRARTPTWARRSRRSTRCSCAGSTSG
jgi:putative CocE/NonD family hydrolase